MSAMPHQKEGTELEQQERLFRGQARQTAATVIAAIIVLMSALLAFITVPPQPLVLLLGILVAVIIYWACADHGTLRTHPRRTPRGATRTVRELRVSILRRMPRTLSAMRVRAYTAQPLTRGRAVYWP